MNEQEKKLREAVESYTNKYDFWEAPDEDYINDKIVELIKSDAVREYHQTLSPNKKINFQKLVEDLRAWRKSTGDNSSSSIAYFIVDELKSNLQPPAPESDIIRKDFIGFNSYLWNKGFVKSGKVDYSQMLVYMEDYIAERKQPKTTSED